MQGQGSSAVTLQSSWMRATHRLYVRLCLKILGRSLILGQVNFTSHHVTLDSCRIGLPWE